MSATPFRTVLHGTCLLGGRHPAGSLEAKECPLNPQRIEARSARAKKAAQSRYRAPGGARKQLDGSAPAPLRMWPRMPRP
jgi:hypothetical protein